MTKAMKIICGLLMMVGTAGAQVHPAGIAGYVSTDGVTWTALTSTATTGGVPYTPPAAGLYGYNSSTGLWYPCSTTNPCAGAGGGGTSFTALTGDATSTSTGGATTVKGINGTLLSGLATGPLCNTTTTGVPTACTAAQNAAFAKNVIYASAGNSTLGVAACALNSNINTGGGTADDSCLQADLDALGTAGGGTLYINGYALLTCSNYGTTNVVDGNVQTTALQTHSNVKIDASGGGVFLQASSNCGILGNNIQGNPAATFQTNMSVVGGVWNGNGANQSKYEQGNSSNYFNVAMWFSGFSGVTINNVTIRNSVTYGIQVSNGSTFVSHDSTVTEDTQLGSGSTNQDGLHLWGTLSAVYVSNLTVVNTDDDVIAINTDEGVANFNVGTQANSFRLPHSGGAISNVLIDGVNMINTEHQVRWYGLVTANGVATVSNITIRNVTGAPQATGMLNSGVTSSSLLTIDDWNVTGGFNSVNVPATTGLSLNNINSSATVTTTGSSAMAISQQGQVTYSNNSITGGANNFLQPTLLTGSGTAINLGAAISSGNYLTLVWDKTGTNAGFGYVDSVGSPFLLASTFTTTNSPLAVDNSGPNAGYSCNTGIALCVSSTSNTAAPFAVNTSGGIVSSTRTGTFTCTSGGAITVANTNAITASSIIITTNTPGGTQTYAPNKTGGTSGTNFIVTCATGDTSIYNYDVIN